MLPTRVWICLLGVVPEENGPTGLSQLSWQNVREFAITHGLRILIIAGLIYLALWPARILSRKLVAVMSTSGGGGNQQERKEWSEFVANVVYKILATIIVAIGLLLIAQEFGVGITPVWTTMTTILAVVGVGFVAMWSVLSNAFCSLLMLIFQPFQIGHFVELHGQNLQGKVINFNLFFTTLRAENGDLVEVPNNLFFQNAIRHRPGDKAMSLSEQLSKDENTE